MEQTDQNSVQYIKDRNIPSISTVIFTGIFASGSLLVALSILNYPLGIVMLVSWAAIAWLVFSFWRPLIAFGLVLAVFVLAYSRLSIPCFVVNGGLNRGNLALGDILWFGLILSVGFKVLLRGRMPLPHLRIIWPVLPFLTLAICLPVLGVIIGNWPASYAIPGLRHLQWISFALLSFWLARTYGNERVVYSVLLIVASASVVHMAYALVQFGYFKGWLSANWVAPDTLFSAQQAHTWFFYPRLTGLLVNPNSYGIFSAFVFLWALLLSFVKIVRNHRCLWSAMIISSLLGLVMSMSRSAFLGIGCAFFVFTLTVAKHTRLLARTCKFAIQILFLFIGLGLVIWKFLPSVLLGRFERLALVFLNGPNMDVNAAARVTEWQHLWDIYLNQYLLGTWVPSSYALNSAIDSFYVATALQGTPLFTLAWLFLMFGVIVIAKRTFMGKNVSLSKSVCGVLIAFGGLMMGSGVSLSPMLQPQLIVPFWVVVGLVVNMYQYQVRRI